MVGGLEGGFLTAEYAENAELRGGIFEGLGEEAHALDAGAGVGEGDAVLEVVLEGDVGVAEEAVGDSIDFGAEVALDAGDGGSSPEVEMVEGIAETREVDEAVEGF